MASCSKTILIANLTGDCLFLEGFSDHQTLHLGLSITHSDLNIVQYFFIKSFVVYRFWQAEKIQIEEERSREFEPLRVLFAIYNIFCANQVISQQVKLASLQI